jgi:hypothetical protein
MGSCLSNVLCDVPNDNVPNNNNIIDEENYCRDPVQREMNQFIQHYKNKPID